MVYIIIGVIIIIVGVVIGIATDTNPIPTILIVLGVFLVMPSEKGKPSAMDVYQGKTTLEITYKDGVAVDSVVVFKEKR